MDDLIKQITEKTGVTAEKAREIVAVVAAWVKEAPGEAREQLTAASGKVAGLASSATGLASEAAATAKTAGAAAVDKGKDLLDRARGTAADGSTATDDDAS